jgi:hypothetical protein
MLISVKVGTEDSPGLQRVGEPQYPGTYHVLLPNATLEWS